MKIYCLLLTAIAIIGILLIIYIFNYNKLQELILKITEAEGIINSELRKKYDSLLKIVKIVNSKNDSKEKYFEQLNKLKIEKLSNFEIDRKLCEYHDLITKIEQDYNKIAQNKSFIEEKKLLKSIEEKLEAAIIYYNKNTTLLNNNIKKFPTNFVAKIHKIKMRNFFDGINLFDDNAKDFKL